MSPHFHRLSGAVATLAMCFAGMASAAPMTYFGADWSAAGAIPANSVAQGAQSTFLGTLQTGYQTEGFSNLGLDPVSQDPWRASQWSGPQTLWTNGSLTPSNFSDPYTILTQNPFNNGTSDTGRFDTTGPSANGDASWWFESDSSFTVSFGGSHSAFGFYVTDAADWGGSFGLELTAEDGSVTSLDVMNATQIPGGGAQNGGLAFFGFTDQSKKYTSVKFVLTQATGYNPNSPDIFGFDDLIVGEVAPMVVPEPASLALVGLALLGAAVTRRRSYATR